MRIKSISVENFRCHDSKTVDILPATTALVGSNGIGKTSIIEALYIGLRGKSFKGSDSEILQKNKDWYKIKIFFEDGSERIVQFDNTKTNSKKQFTVNDKKSARLKATDKYPIVLFEPDHLRLLTGSPTRRRDFIDNFISQIDPSYGTILSRYNKVLKQRNNLLKNPTSNIEDLFVWDVSLSEYGSSILERRKRAVEILNSDLQDKYASISNNSDTLKVVYKTNLNSAQDIINNLNNNYQKDKALQYTSVGPHRDDLEFIFNNYPASSVASRGETRSIVLAIKNIEIDQVYSITGKQPLILLDDVYSELDKNRQNSLTTSYQSIITTTDNIDIDDDIKVVL